MLKTWNLLLIGLTYTLCLFGTFLTRSGVVQSVHAFAQTPIFAAVFLGYVLVTAVDLPRRGAVVRREDLQGRTASTRWCRGRRAFLLNNWVFIAILAMVFLGTLFPVFSELFVRAPHGLGPALLQLRADTVRDPAAAAHGSRPPDRLAPRLGRAALRRQFAWPCALGLLAGLGAWLLARSGMRSTGSRTSTPWSTWGLAAFVTATIVQEYARAIRARVRRARRERPAGLLTLLRRNQQRYGGYIIHLGFVFMMIGFAGTILNEERLENVEPGSEIRVRDYRLRYLTAEALPAQHYGGARARIALYRDDEPLGVMTPEKRMYWLAAAARLDPLDLLDAARGSLRDPDRPRSERLGDASRSTATHWSTGSGSAPSSWCWARSPSCGPTPRGGRRLAANEAHRTRARRRMAWRLAPRRRSGACGERGVARSGVPPCASIAAASGCRHQRGPRAAQPDRPGDLPAGGGARRARAALQRRDPGPGQRLRHAARHASREPRAHGRRAALLGTAPPRRPEGRVQLLRCRARPGSLAFERRFAGEPPRVVCPHPSARPAGARCAACSPRGSAASRARLPGRRSQAARAGERLASASPSARARGADSLVHSKIWLELDDAALEVEEQHVLRVEGEAPLVAESDAPLLCLALPAGAEGLRFSPTSLAIGLDPDASGVLAVRGPIPPGDSTLALGYRLPVEGSALRFERRFPRALPLLSVVVADTGILAETTRLHRLRSIRTEDRTYLQLEGFEIEPEERVVIDLRQLPAPRPLSALASAGFTALAAAGAIAFLIAPLRGGRQPEDTAETRAGAPRGRARGRLRQHPRPRRGLRDRQADLAGPRRAAGRAACPGGAAAPAEREAAPPPPPARGASPSRKARRERRGDHRPRAHQALRARRGAGRARPRPRRRREPRGAGPQRRGQVDPAAPDRRPRPPDRGQPAHRRRGRAAAPGARAGRLHRPCDAPLPGAHGAREPDLRGAHARRRRSRRPRAGAPRRRGARLPRPIAWWGASRAAWPSAWRSPGGS